LRKNKCIKNKTPFDDKYSFRILKLEENYSLKIKIKRDFSEA